MEDVDNDGVKELIVGYTDRFVRIYKWVEENEMPSCNTSPTKKISISSALKKVRFNCLLGGFLEPSIDSNAHSNLWFVWYNSTVLFFHT